jgi:hypothetical protein
VAGGRPTFTGTSHCDIQPTRGVGKLEPVSNKHLEKEHEPMENHDDLTAASVQASVQHAPAIPLEQLVAEVYSGASPALQSRMLTQLVGQVYEASPVVERRRLLEQLLRPLGLLSIVAVANGIFAQFRLRGGWSELQLQPQDIQGIRSSDVMALVEHVQQVSVEAVDGLAQLLARSPVLAGSAAAALLTRWLMQRARNRRASDAEALD